MKYTILTVALLASTMLMPIQAQASDIPEGCTRVIANWVNANKFNCRGNEYSSKASPARKASSPAPTPPSDEDDDCPPKDDDGDNDNGHGNEDDGGDDDSNPGNDDGDDSDGNNGNGDNK